MSVSEQNTSGLNPLLNLVPRVRHLVRFAREVSCESAASAAEAASYGFSSANRDALRRLCLSNAGCRYIAGAQHTYDPPTHQVPSSDVLGDLRTSGQRSGKPLGDTLGDLLGDP